MVLTQRCDGYRLYLQDGFPYHYGSHATKASSGGRYTSLEFPYHYGSHATESFRLVQRTSTSFHTTMVLTQPMRFRGASKKSLCFHTTMVLTQRRRFQGFRFFRFGFHTTMVLTQPNQSGTRDSKKYVSIPLWFSRNLSRFMIFASSCNVSIPLWFSRNLLKLLRKYGIPYEFPYHYGSHATYEGWASDPDTLAFPYHYGSHATRIHRSAVSSSLCFHTTMVLTQPSRGG